MPEERLPLTVATLLATIQGLLAQQVPKAQRTRVLAFALERLVPEER